ncbi:hypothetical protein AB0J74_01665 [Asanoa sp. NPDC049573]|uniref:hypothetical protein n=1 Tax=Asanoa sp. NPDC049573 TaxID=3155396 RepID=UPI003429A3AC
MITRARVSGCFDSSFVAGLVLLAFALAGALLSGALLGLAGAAFDPVTRAVLTGLAALAVLLGALTRPVPWQLDRETDRRWLDYHDWRTAALNGFALGLGFTTRIGYWLFYFVLLAAFAIADPVLAAAGTAAYALSRVGGSLLLAATGIEVAGRGWIPRLRTATDAVLFAALGHLAVVLVRSLV